MSMPDRIRQAALRAQDELADADTPLLRNAWYVAALAPEVTRAPLARRLLDIPVVLYRREDGRAVALEDRCAHRSFPLSRGQVVGDYLVCGYHGACYGADGRCAQVPSQVQVPPGAVVRSFPLVETGALLWIWPGDPALADPALLPLQPWMTDADWTSSTERLHLRASHVRLHENLLDLTHLSFLHANSFGTPDYASAPFETMLDEAAGRFSLHRTVSPTRLPPLWAVPTGLGGVDAARVVSSSFLSPALHVVTVKFYACALPEDAQPARAIRTAHLVTPESATRTHYFIQHARNFALDDAEITRFMHQQLLQAFQEDVDGLEAIETLLAGYPDRQPEISFQADKASLAMRRWLKRQAGAEALSRRAC
jgi:phenylpropionate dioxygenase-like ring-hydroxylating dioxygenase large terminal subunit